MARGRDRVRTRYSVPHIGSSRRPNVSCRLSAAELFVTPVANEQLSIPGAQAALAEKLRSVASVFLGPWSAQSIGDYASGTNHVLPTSGGARTRGGLSAADFVRCTSVQQVSAAGLRSLSPVVAALADAEGLVAHWRAVEVRQ